MIEVGFRVVFEFPFDESFEMSLKGNECFVRRKVVDPPVFVVVVVKDLRKHLKEFRSGGPAESFLCDEEFRDSVEDKEFACFNSNGRYVDLDLFRDVID